MSTVGEITHQQQHALLNNYELIFLILDALEESPYSGRTRNLACLAHVSKALCQPALNALRKNFPGLARPFLVFCEDWEEERDSLGGCTSSTGTRARTAKSDTWDRFQIYAHQVRKVTYAHPENFDCSSVFKSFAAKHPGQPFFPNLRSSIKRGFLHSFDVDSAFATSIQILRSKTHFTCGRTRSPSS
ncbi:hypothetical protein OBBRIDRAFT_795855 [Obba rivulosa]|uniref:Uncharacterized protein n=1 Tax=Obba rivulosa TaxID=1052685 RepID=A0A8E2ATP9_9APHY|nr:hypothetical protein OBBRIDRAFT_795855 [Obba rivulosa]